MSCIFLTGLQQENSVVYIYTLFGDHLKSLRYLEESGDEGPRNSSVVPKISLLKTIAVREL